MNVRFELEKAEVNEQSAKALRKAQNQEEACLKNGYRYFSVNGRTKIMVECDADGTPTERGQRVIDALKRQMGL